MSGVLGGIAAGAAGDLISGGISSLFGGDGAERIPATLLGFNAGGMTLRRSGNTLNLRSRGEREAAVKGVRNTFANLAQRYRQFGKKITPGFGQLTRSMRSAIRDQGRAARSDLNDMFARRRISGSSFAADTMSRLNSEFAQKEAEAVAKAKVMELEMTQQNIGQEYAARAQAFQTMLTNFNFDATMAAQLSIAGQNAINGLAGSQAALATYNQDRQDAIWAPFATSAGEGAAAIINRYLTPTASGGGGFSNPAGLGITGP